MIYTVELATDVDEVCAAYPNVAHETMRCAPPEIDLHPDRAITHVAVEHGYAYVARDEQRQIRGAALIWPDGHVKWLTLPTQDSLAVMEALLNYFKDETGISPWGEIENAHLREQVYGHTLMSVNGNIGTWRRD